MEEKVEIVRKYFSGQNKSDADGVTPLFADDAEVYNVNFPPFRGKDGIRAFCQNLFERTATRQFNIVDIAENRDFVMAEWTVNMTFREGAKLGHLKLTKPFDVELRGINKFEFEPNSDKIKCLRIYHETTTVLQKAEASIGQ